MFGQEVGFEDLLDLLQLLLRLFEDRDVVEVDLGQVDLVKDRSSLRLAVLLPGHNLLVRRHVAGA